MRARARCPDMLWSLHTSLVASGVPVKVKLTKEREWTWTNHLHISVLSAAGEGGDAMHY